MKDFRSLFWLGLLALVGYLYLAGPQDRTPTPPPDTKPVPSKPEPPPKPKKPHCPS